jgi:predicted dehydrogenase
MNFGIIGTGNGARDFIIGLNHVPQAKAVAVGSRSESRAKTFANALGIPAAHGTYTGLVNDPSVQIVYIATQHDSHYADCMLALNAGKHVLCEKPFALNAAQAKEIFDLAKSKSLFCMEAMWMRFMPLVLEAKAWVDQGKIGKVQALRADFGYIADTGPQSRFYDAKAGGGALLDRGVYLLSLAQLILGNPTMVQGSAQIVRGVDAHSTYLLNYANGASAMLHASLVAQTSNEAVIYGEKGTITIQSPFYRPHLLSISPSAGGQALPDAARGLGSKEKLMQTGLVKQLFFRLQKPMKNLLGKEKTSLKPWEGNGYNYEAAETVRCIANKAVESPLLSHADTIAVLEVADTLRQNWKTTS